MSYSQFVNKSRVNDRKIDELIGLCRGELADGHVCQQEAEFLLSWLNSNIEVANGWPANVLFQRLQNMLKDNVLDHKEEAELIDTLLQLIGSATPEPDAEPLPTTLPLCDPPPEVEFEDKIFCFTGKFSYGSRKTVEGKAFELNGSAKKDPTRDTDYLVIGSIGNSDWLHSTHDRKIERAVELKKQGHKIQIVSEEHWVKSVDRLAPIIPDSEVEQLI